MSRVIGTGSLSGYIEDDFCSELSDIMRLRGDVNSDLEQLHQHATLLYVSCVDDEMADNIYAVIFELKMRMNLLRGLK